MMKIQNYLFLSILFLSILSFNSCIQDKCDLTQTYVRFDPVFMTKAEMRSEALESLDPIEMKNTGKIYFYNHFIFVNEIREGIHILDNTDPSNPIPVSFLQIPGNMDISIKDNVIYAQSFLDLWTIDMNDPVNPSLIDIELDIFENQYNFFNDNRAIVYYNESEVTEEISCRDNGFGLASFIRGNSIFANVESVDAFGGTKGETVTPNGIAGSFARMRIVDDYLYLIDKSNLYVFSIEGKPTKLNTINVGWNIETLFPYKDNLFIGSTSGMYIFDKSDPTAPKLLSQFYHTSSCDPVFVKDDVAFITLRNGNQCQGFTNQMEVVDISDLKNPKLIKKYAMDNPHGLSIADNTLFLCDGKSGLKVFNIEDVKDIKEVDAVKNIDTYDVISLSSKQIIFVIGKDGLYQFDVSNPKDVKQISFIPVGE